MKGQRLGYIRVSTVDQNIDRQLEGIELDKVFTDKVSGKDTNRPELQRMLEFVQREGIEAAKKKGVYKGRKRALLPRTG